jgi:prevent-host-death family protein
MDEPRERMPVSELQNRLSATLAQARRAGQPITITQRGKAAGVLLGIEDDARLVELADRAEVEEMVARAEQALATGDVLDWEAVKRERLGWLRGP